MKSKTNETLIKELRKKLKIKIIRIELKKIKRPRIKIKNKK
jgi:hypothetical protein